MVHAFAPQHLIDLAEYLKTKEFSQKDHDLQCIDRTIVNRAYLSHICILRNGLSIMVSTMMSKIIQKKM